MSDGSPSASGRLPDLYALLGLEPLEPDRTRIQQSLQRLAGQIQARSQTDAKDATSRAQIERARKLLELGKQHLLDPDRKARYDQQWQAVIGTHPSSPTAGKQSLENRDTGQASEQASKKKQVATATRLAVAKIPLPAVNSDPTWDLSELQALLPKGDPSAPFSPAEYLAGRGSEVALSYAEDFNKLLSLLAPQAAPGQRTAIAESHVAAESGVAADVSTTPATSEKPAALMLPNEQSAVHAPVSARPPATPLAQRLRKKQGPPLLWRAIGVLSAVGIVLGVAFWRLQPASAPSLAAKPAQDSVPAQPVASEMPSVTRQPAAGASDGEIAPRRSGLPSVPGIDAVMPTDGTSQEGSSMGAEASSAPGPSAMQGAAMQDSAMQDSAMSDKPAMDAVPDAGTIELSDDERQQWTESMLSARKAIGRQQFTQATAQLGSLQLLAKTQPQTQQLARLVTTEQLAQRFRQALDNALAGMGAAESFSFGNSNLASLVEADGERVVLRIEGRNQTFSMSELPVDISFAIVDLAMDREHPRSLAAKAAFILVHPAAQGDQRAGRQARQMMAAAVDAGAVAQDMQQIFQDDFVLP